MLFLLHFLQISRISLVNYHLFALLASLLSLVFADSFDFLVPILKFSHEFLVVAVDLFQLGILFKRLAHFNFDSLHDLNQFGIDTFDASYEKLVSAYTGLILVCLFILASGLTRSCRLSLVLIFNASHFKHRGVSGSCHFENTRNVNTVVL